MPNTLLAKGAPKVSSEAVKEALEWMKTALVDVQSNLTMAQQRMKRVVDKKRQIEEYSIGDEVVLSTEILRTYCPNLPTKIKARWVGPFHIQKIVSPIAFGLDLSPGLQIHPIFHVNKLKPLYPFGGVLEEGQAAAPCIGGGYSGI